MSRRIRVALLLLGASLFAQEMKPRADTTFISRAKKSRISNFDPALPSLTLESFLKYETGDMSIDWKESECEGLHLNQGLHLNLDQQFHSQRCVTAYSALPDAGVITVTLQVPNRVSQPLTLLSVTVIAKGLEHRIQLIQVPAVVQGSKVPGQAPDRWPRDFFPLRRAS